jgi:hypothetical protein
MNLVSSNERTSKRGTAPATSPVTDYGSVALEFLICGLLAPTLVVGGVLTLASAQRSQIAAQQLAREYVRSQALGLGSQEEQAMRESVADGLRLDLDSVELSSRLLEQGSVVEATARVGAAVETARMRVQK